MKNTDPLRVAQSWRGEGGGGRMLFLIPDPVLTDSQSLYHS